jgi:hypothetical protein
MATYTYKLSDATAKALADARAVLADEKADHQNEFDEQGERWHESDKGENTATWLETLDTLIDDLDNVPKEPEK